MDATTLAEFFVQDLQERAGSLVEGWKFTGTNAGSSKYTIVQELVRMLSEHRLAIPYDRDIINELRYFQYEITPAKNLRMAASQGHDDIVMSLALAAHLAMSPHEIGFFGGVDLEVDGMLAGGSMPLPRPSRAVQGTFPLGYDPVRAWFNDDYAREHGVDLD